MKKNIHMLEEAAEWRKGGSESGRGASVYTYLDCKLDPPFFQTLVPDTIYNTIHCLSP